MTLTHPGFADPVLDSQACFRAVLDAMARPGAIHTLRTPAAPPPPLDRATAAVLLTLADADTPLWLDPAAAGAAGWVAFHCGAALAAPGAAAFAVALSSAALAEVWPALQTGSDEGPEDSATIIVQVAALGTGAPLRLAGPGLAAPALLRVEGLWPGFVEARAVNHALFPRGMDVVLCAGDRVAALPRTTRVEAA